MDLQILDYQNILYSPLFSKIIVTLIILVVGIIIGRTMGKILLRILHELGLNRLIKETTKVTISLEKILSSFVAYFIYFITLIMALTHL